MFEFQELERIRLEAETMSIERHGESRRSTRATNGVSTSVRLSRALARLWPFSLLARDKAAR
jgi:hypothetical protein